MYQDGYVEVYDLVMRHRGRDYDGEARQIAALVRERHPEARALLDVACGTGLHLRSLVTLFEQVHGLDSSPDMLAMATTRTPDLVTHRGDMRSFALGRTFDAITCMFAVPHLTAPDELDAFVALLVRHLTRSGVLVLEPWYTPDQFLPGFVAKDVVEDGDRTIVRLSHSRRVADNRVSITVHHVDVAPRAGLRHSTEQSELTLFWPEEFQAAFAKAGCTAEHLDVAPFSWGLWVARRSTGHRPAVLRSRSEAAR